MQTLKQRQPPAPTRADLERHGIPAQAQRVTVDEPRVYRQYALPVSAFDVLKDLQRAWGMQTAAEAVTRLLYEAGPQVLKNEVTRIERRTR